MTAEDAHRVGESKQLLAEEVFERIGAAIVQGDLAPLTRIRDSEMATRLHVSRTPVREALQRLERIGLVAMRPSRYTEVTEVTDEMARDAQEFAAYQSGVVARLASTRMGDDERARALELVDAATEPGDALAQALRRRELFQHLAAACGNMFQRSVLQEMSLALSRNLQHAPAVDATAAYARLREALATGDAEAAERAARAIHGVG